MSRIRREPLSCSDLLLFSLFCHFDTFPGVQQTRKCVFPPPLADSDPTFRIPPEVCHRLTFVLDRCDTPRRSLTQSSRPIKEGVPRLAVKKKCFLTNHLIIAIAFAHPNLSPSLFIAAATLSEASSPPTPPPSHHRDPPHPPPWPPMFFALRPPWGTPCWTVRCVGT